MNLRNPHLWIAAAAAILVISIALVDAGRSSPGELSRVHMREPDLAGRGGCSECHGGWRENMTTACLECHVAVAEQVEAREGFHGAIDAVRGGRCGSCHSDHHGAGFDIVNLQSFRLAGFDDAASFDHAAIGFAMDGAHLELDCTECHPHADDEVLDQGALRFMGLDQSCTECHEDAHEGSMVPSCAQCHGQSSFDDLHSLGHEEFLPLIGGHAQVSCRECHGETSIYSLESLGRGMRELSARECADCHESPHATDFIENLARLVAASPEGSCATCHAAEHETFDEEQIEVSARHHTATGFPLEEPHEDATCAECHSHERMSFAARYPGRTPDACSVCHADPHGGQFEDGPFAGLECTACHEDVRFEPHAFGMEEHDRTAMPLTGAHVDTDCALCHEVPFEGRPRLFNGTPSRCGRCHEDAHRGFFAEPASRLDGNREGCAACHSTSTFSDEQCQWFDHGEWAGFPLEGAHEQADCESCHPRSESRDEAGRSFGFAAEHFGEFEGCVTCHADPHEGLFDDPDLPRWVNGGRGCERCHTPASFRYFEGGFDHGRWTGFELEGAHLKAGCASCHPPLPSPTTEGRTWAPAAGSACATCHVDPHAGQFVEDGETDCARCHTVAATSFTELVFNHTWDSRFPLGEAHSQVACASCHPKVTASGTAYEGVGDPIVRYRPLKRDCVDCHGDHREPLRRREAREPIRRGTGGKK